MMWTTQTAVFESIAKSALFTTISRLVLSLTPLFITGAPCAQPPQHITLWEVRPSPDHMKRIHNVGMYDHAWLGLDIIQVIRRDEAQQAHLLFKVVRRSPGGPAERAGLEVGSLIYKVGRQLIYPPTYLKQNSRRTSSTDKVVFEIVSTTDHGRSVNIDLRRNVVLMSGLWSQLSKYLMHYLAHLDGVSAEYRQLEGANAQALRSALVTPEGALRCEGVGRDLTKHQNLKAQDLVLLTHSEGISISRVGGTTVCLSLERAKGLKMSQLYPVMRELIPTR